MLEGFNYKTLVDALVCIATKLIRVSHAIEMLIGHELKEKMLDWALNGVGPASRARATFREERKGKNLC